MQLLRRRSFTCQRHIAIAIGLMLLRKFILWEPDQVIALTEWMDDKMFEEFTPSLIGSRPNTYTFTKALAEQMLQRERGSLPVAIVRPSIVLSSYKEPVAGWVDNCNGPTGIIAAVGKGFFR